MKLQVPVSIVSVRRFYVMDSSPDAAVIDYTRQKEIESQVAVSHKILLISRLQLNSTSETYIRTWQNFVVTFEKLLG